MRKFILATASTIDADRSWLDKRNIPMISYSFELNEQVHIDDCMENTKRTLYSEMRKGNQPRTSQITVFTYYEFFKSLIEKDNNVLFMDMDRALSSSYFNSLKAAEQIKEDYPQSNLYILDTRCVTAGLAMLVAMSADLADEGKSMEEVIAWAEENKMKIRHRFVVDDLEWLKRGGRLSNSSAFIGSLLAIKPIIHVDNEGKLVAYAKVRGRKKALRTLLEDSQKDILDPSATDVIIAHADCIDDAKAFAEAVREKYPAIRSVNIMELGPVIGCHVGPGLIAMIYMASAKDRIA